MMTIYKYHLDTVERQKVPMSKGAKLLTVALQHGQPMLWALVDTKNPSVDRDVYIVPTGGNAAPSGTSYVGTLLVSDGALVFHVFA